MKAVQAVKKMVALGMGLTMVGATLFGASAAKLSDYPAPFVVDGTPASNLAIVVGDQAQASDVAGSIDIVQGLQQHAVKRVAGQAGGPSQIAVEGDAVEIGSTSDLLEINEFIGDVRETLTEVDLDMLKGGQVVTDQGSTEFNQYLRFVNNSGRVTFDQDERDRVGHYLFFNDGDFLFQWELEFEEGLESEYSAATRDLEDLEDEDVTILGQPFVIVDTDVINNSPAGDAFQGSPDITIDFIGGAISAVLGENDKETYVIDGKEYEVEVLVISETAASGEGSVKFRINGEITDELTDGETDVLADGTQIGIRDILATGKDIQKSIVQFYLGAYKVEFADRNTSDATFQQAAAEVNEETIEDSAVQISAGFLDAQRRDFSISTIRYNLTADAVLGDMFVPPGTGVREQLDEPEGMLTPSWDIRYEGLMDTGVSLVRIDSAGNDEYDLEFTNQEGIFFDFPLASYESSTLGFKYGTDDDDLWFQENDGVTVGHISRQDYFVVSDCIADVPSSTTFGNSAGAASDNTCFSHVLRYDSIDTTNGKLTFTDLGTGTREITFANGGATMATRTGRLIVGGITYAVRVSPTTPFNLSIDLNADGAFGPNATNTGKVLVGIQGEGLIDLGFENTTNSHAVGHAIPTDALYTGFGAALAAAGGGGPNFNMSLITLSKEFDETAGDEVINVTIESRAQNRIGINALGNDGATFFSGLQDLEENEDLEQALTGYGVFFELYDPTTNDQAEDLTVEYPLSQRGARVFVTGGVVSVSELAVGGGEVIQPIQIGAAKLASEVSDVTQHNAVVVGGPCANPIAATLLGNPEPCWESVPENTAIVKLVEHANANVALLVNGRTALNTRMASRAVATGEVANVDGMEAQVTGTSLGDITVAAV